MFRKRLIAGGVAMLGLATFLARGQEQELDSLKVCKDTQKLLFENSLVRIIDDVIPPGGAEPLHRHPHGVVVTLAEADAETVNAAGVVAKTHFRVGATWSEPTVHQVRNIGTTPTHWIRIDVK